eukprot:6190043-Pleurochrysis_carterae.AAC.2
MAYVSLATKIGPRLSTALRNRRQRRRLPPAFQPFPKSEQPEDGQSANLKPGTKPAHLPKPGALLRLKPTVGLG